MTSPVMWTPSLIPSRSRLAAAWADGHSRRSETWSVRQRLISSGIRGLNDLKPASTWATGRWSLAATSAAASVLLVSPKTTTTLGWRSTRIGSSRFIISPVWAPWSAEPTPR